MINKVTKGAIAICALALVAWSVHEWDADNQPAASLRTTSSVESVPSGKQSLQSVPSVVDKDANRIDEEPVPHREEWAPIQRVASVEEKEKSLEQQEMELNDLISGFEVVRSQPARRDAYLAMMRAKMSAYNEKILPMALQKLEEDDLQQWLDSQKN